jgi:hypothetical protein
MCSTTTIIYIVIAFIVLLFIYNYMKKNSEGLETGSLTELSIQKCTSNDIDISKELIELEKKIKNVNRDLSVKLNKNPTNYYIEFIQNPAIKIELSDDLSMLSGKFIKILFNIDIKQEIINLKNKLGPDMKLQYYKDNRSDKILIVKN